MKNCPLVCSHRLKKESTTEHTETTEKDASAFLCELCVLRGEAFLRDQCGCSVSGVLPPGRLTL
jgi:hypothetical protein